MVRCWESVLLLVSIQLLVLQYSRLNTALEPGQSCELASQLRSAGRSGGRHPDARGGNAIFSQMFKARGTYFIKFGS